MIWKKFSLIIAWIFSTSSFSLQVGFTGDLMFHDAQKKYAAKQGYSSFFQAVSPFFLTHDLVFGNLETPVAPGGKNDPYLIQFAPVFNTPEKVLPALRLAGFHLLNLAHNHIFDQGLKGIEETFQNVKKHGLIPLGVGAVKKNLPYEVTIKQGKKLVWIAMAKAVNCAEYVYGQYAKASPLTVLPVFLAPWARSKPLQTLRETYLAKEIRAIREKEKPDAVILSIHWGKEYDSGALKEDQKLARLFLDSGADIIIGHHPHVLGPSELILTSDRRIGLVMYSLGNFTSSMGSSYTRAGGNEAQAKKRDGLFLSLSFGGEIDPGLKKYLDHFGFKNYQISFSRIRIFPLWNIFEKTRMETVIIQEELKKKISDELRRILIERKQVIEKMYPDCFREEHP